MRVANKIMRDGEPIKLNAKNVLADVEDYKALTSDDDIVSYSRRNLSIAPLSYHTIFDLQGRVDLLSCSLYGVSVYARLTIDGKVMFEGSLSNYYNAKDTAGDSFSVLTLPRALSKNSMKLEIYNAGSSEREFACMVMIRP